MEKEIYKKQELTKEELDKLENRYKLKLVDSVFSLEVLHKMRNSLLETFNCVEDANEYIEANELITDMERKIWNEINEYKI